MKMRKYYRVSKTGKVLGEVVIRLDQFRDLADKIAKVDNQKLMRKIPHK